MGTYTWSSSVKKVCPFCPIFSVTCLSQYGLITLCFLLWVVIQGALLLTFLLRLFLLWPLELLQAASVSLSYVLLVCVVLLEQFLLFGIILHFFSCSSPEISLFSKELLFLLLRMGFRMEPWAPDVFITTGVSLLLGAR